MLNKAFARCVEDLLQMPSYCVEESVILAKVVLEDGRDAVIKVSLSTEEDDLDSEVWEPK